MKITTQTGKELDINLTPPIQNFGWSRSVSQLFGVNRQLYMQNFGLPGHNGIDIVAHYGAPILAEHDGIISRLNYETKWRTNGNGIYLTSLDGEYTTIYWHLSEIQVVAGQQVKQGDTIGLMGNTGFCRPIPTAQNPYAGTHLHNALEIKETINKVQKEDYDGLCDIVPFLWKEGDRLNIRFLHDLYYQSSGDEVAWLQTCLKLEGLAKDYEPIGNFGRATASDVMEFQKRNNLTPTIGYFGKKTRTIIGDKYTTYSFFDKVADIII